MLWKMQVKLDNKVLDHKYFSDCHDVALGLSTDSFSPFNKRKSTAWPLILFNYNLPPDIHFHVNQILMLSVIPGPKNPQDYDSFLWPFLQEMFHLTDGGVESYGLPKAVWEAIGKGTALLGSTISSAYGSHVPSIATSKVGCTADMWSFWMLYLKSVLLHNHFQHQ